MKRSTTTVPLEKGSWSARHGLIARAGNASRRIECELATPIGLPGLLDVADYGGLKELRLERGADLQRVLPVFMSRGKGWHFEMARPSRKEIFVRIANPDAKEARHA
jgi:hypothetical protein